MELDISDDGGASAGPVGFRASELRPGAPHGCAGLVHAFAGVFVPDMEIELNCEPPAAIR